MKIERDAYIATAHESMKSAIVYLNDAMDCYQLAGVSFPLAVMTAIQMENDAEVYRIFHVPYRDLTELSTAVYRRSDMLGDDAAARLMAVWEKFLEGGYDG